MKAENPLVTSRMDNGGTNSVMRSRKICRDNENVVYLGFQLSKISGIRTQT